MEKLTEQSEYFITHFIENKVQSRVFKNDSNLLKKLEGIDSAIKEGYLRTTTLVDGSVRVSATVKLSDYYNF